MDRTTLPVPERTFGGVAGRTVADSQPDWSIVAPVTAQDNVPNVLMHHTYAFLGVESYLRVSDDPLPAGDITVEFVFESDSPTADSGGAVTLWAGAEKIGEGHMPKTVPIAFTSSAGMDIGRDNGLVVDRDYEDKAPYPCTGAVREVVFDLHPVAEEDAHALHQHSVTQAVAGGAAG